MNFTLVNDNVSADTQWYPVTNLAPSTTYYFRIAAVDAAGQSAYATISCTTSPAGSGNLPANSQDLASTDAVDIGMNLNFYGQTFNQVYVNWNGNITIGQSINQHISPDYPLENNPYYSAIIAPFFADADNRYSGTITYGSTTSNEGGALPSSRPAWQASWNNVDYFDVTGSWYNNTHQSKYDTFSVTLVDRSDVAAGDFDIVFSYGGITWDTGDESGGVNGLADPAQTSYPARIGYSNGTGDSGTYYEVPGSGAANAFLGMTGAYTFPIRDTSVGLTAYRTGGNYGQAVSATVQQSGDPANYVNLVDDGTDLANDGTTTNIQYNDQLIAVTAGGCEQPEFRPHHAQTSASPTGFVAHRHASHSHTVQHGLGAAIRQEWQFVDQLDGNTRRRQLSRWTVQRQRRYLCRRAASGPELLDHL